MFTDLLLHSLASGTVLWHQCQMGSDRRKSSKESKGVLLRGLQGS